MRKPLLPGAFFLLVKVLSRITCRGRGDMGFDVVVCKGEVLGSVCWGRFGEYWLE